MGYYPVFLDIKGTLCVVVGGGRVAARKAAGLLNAGASLTIISPEVTDELNLLVDNKGVCHLKRPYRAGDIRGAGLVIAASSDRAVNELVLAEARAEHVLVNVVDDPGVSAFITPSTIRRGRMCIAVSTAGRCPALSRRTRLEIERAIGPEYGPFLEIIGAVRERLLKNSLKGDKKDRIINGLLESKLLGLIGAGKVSEVDKVLYDVAGQRLADLGLDLDKTIARYGQEDEC